MSVVYKLNIFKETGEDYILCPHSLLPISHFTRIDPMYINIENTDIEQIKKKIFTLIAEKIIFLNSDIKPGVLEFEIINNNYVQKPICIKNNFTSIMELLMENSVLIYKCFTHKTWYRYCIGFTKTTHKGSEYTIEEITNYISKMLETN